MKAYSEKESFYLVPETNLVADTINELRDFFLAQLNDNPDRKKVIFDAEGIDIVDSLGVNLIIGLYRQVDSESNTFQIINAGDKFLKIASFFRFPTLFKIEGGEKK